LQHFHRTVSGALGVVSHLDLLMWLQGDLQSYLPHDMLIAVWGDFSTGALHHDVISAMPDVRSLNSDTADINSLMSGLYAKWQFFGNRPFGFNTQELGVLLPDGSTSCALGHALKKMRSALVHGVVDRRGGSDCLYATFSSQASAADAGRAALPILLAHMDLALRQVTPLPHQLPKVAQAANSVLTSLAREHGLSERELEVLQWVTAGKTNPEIGLILDLSEFTIKNHLKRIFKKLDVINRAQAVGKLQTMTAVNV
jgi:transcriptional regulator EpsA